MIPPTSIDGTDITGATIDGTDVQEITVDGDTVFTAAADLPASAIAHYDAKTDGQSTGTITSIPDKIGALDLSGGGSLVSSGINGNKSYEFVASNSDTFSASFAADESQPNTIIKTVQSDLLDALRTSFDGVNKRQEIALDGDSTRDEYFLFAGATLRGGTETTDPTILTAVFDGGNSLIRLNGSQIASGNSGSTAMDGITLGSLQGGQGRFWDGYIGETVACNTRLSSNEIDTEEQRQANRWGITLP